MTPDRLERSLIFRFPCPPIMQLRFATETARPGHREKAPAERVHPRTLGDRLWHLDPP